jgi:hypothetical protein
MSNKFLREDVGGRFQDVIKYVSDLGQVGVFNGFFHQ